MPHNMPDIWKTLFGTAWETLTEMSPDIGGVLIDHESRSVFMDKNAVKLAGTASVPEYGEMTALLAKLVEHSEAGSKLAVKVFAYSSGYTAAVLRLRDYSDRKRRSVLPVCEISELTMAMTRNTDNSVLALLKIETEGSADPSEYRIFGALTSIMKLAPEASLLSEYSKDHYWLYIPCFPSDTSPAELLAKMQEAVRQNAATSDFGEPLINAANVTFSAGIAADLPIPAQRMNTAEFALYSALSAGAGSVCEYDTNSFEEHKSEYERIRRFNLLVDENLFVYHFQPIVSARSGSIEAYEILMRTESEIDMRPLEILECAEKTGRLYDIESATLHNAMELLGRNQEVFENRKLFVNSITAHMLTDSDWQQLEMSFGELLEKIVIEFTEQSEIDDSELAVIKERLGRNNIRLAVDDYGTGYSNTSNLLRYGPDYVKIDRALITDINSNPKMQKLVSGIIEFVHANGYQALAEGVETFEELRTMIFLGSDLIQGYFVSMPKPVLLREVSESVRKAIYDINNEFSEDIQKQYRPCEGEEINLSELISEHYTSVFVDVGSVTICGIPGSSAAISVIVKDGIDTQITMKDASLTTDKDDPIISLGKGSDVILVAEGENEILKRGIYVPKTASLTVLGSGSLNISSESADSYGIGTPKDQECGNITVDMNGTLYVSVNGDTSIAVGGGSLTGGSIKFSGGNTHIHCSGGTCIGVGFIDGNGSIEVKKAAMLIEISSSYALGIGSVNGRADISMVNYNVTASVTGLSLCCIGILENGGGRISLEDGSLDENMRGKNISCIGGRSSETECSISTSKVILYCEGAAVLGVGDLSGLSPIDISDSKLYFTFHTNEGNAFGSEGDLLRIERTEQDINVNK